MLCLYMQLKVDSLISESNLKSCKILDNHKLANFISGKKVSATFVSNMIQCKTRELLSKFILHTQLVTEVSDSNQQKTLTAENQN